MTNSSSPARGSALTPLVQTGEPEATATSRQAWWTLAVILLLVLYTIADRPMINLQVEPLRKELSLSDFQVGMVQGVSVALFTAFLGYPIAWLADRFDRRWVLAASMTVWCVSLGLAGLARSFEALFLASAFVGAGEAALVPIALAMIPELFRGDRRHLANSILLVGARLGAGAVIALCGWTVVAVDAWRPLLPAGLESLSTWRLALMAVALPGVVLVPLILTMPRPSSRRAASGEGQPQGTGPLAGPRPAAAPVWPFLQNEKLTFASFCLGIGLQALAIGCLLNFGPVVAMRLMGATPVQAGNGMGAATFIATVVGFVIAQGVNRQLGQRLGHRLPPLALMATAACGAVSVICMFFSTTPTHLFIGVGVMLTCVMAGTLQYPTALQDITPAPMRARLVAISVTVNTVCGACGPAIVGAVSDALKPHPNGLLLAMLGVALAALVLSFLFLIPLASRYPGTVAAARRAEGALTTPLVTA